LKRRKKNFGKQWQLILLLFETFITAGTLRLLPHVIHPNKSLVKKCNKHGECDVLLFMLPYVVIDLNQNRGIRDCFLLAFDGPFKCWHLYLDQMDGEQLCSGHHQPHHPSHHGQLLKETASQNMPAIWKKFIGAKVLRID
jgi:hypothetical protein